MGVYIKGFIPTDGLYQIKDGVIWKYKAKGGTVRPYELVEVKEPHGRLKDEREMLKFLEEEGGDGIAYDAVVNSPTIIGESERSNEPIEEAEELGKSEESEEDESPRRIRTNGMVLIGKMEMMDVPWRRTMINELEQKVEISIDAEWWDAEYKEKE